MLQTYVQPRTFYNYICTNTDKILTAPTLSDFDTTGISGSLPDGWSAMTSLSILCVFVVFAAHP